MKQTQIVARGVMALCVALALTSCSALRPQVRLSDPQLIYVPGPTKYVPVPDNLTAPTPKPAAPTPKCVDIEGATVLCNRQLDAWREAYEAALDSANADKAAIAELKVEEPK